MWIKLFASLQSSPGAVRDATRQAAPPPGSSDPTVTSSVLEFSGEDEEGGEGGDWNVEDQLPHVPQAEQEEVA